MQLNDPSIRKALKLKLQRQPVKPRAVVEELRIHNGNAIADVVALYSEAHCYEIKGSNDKIERIVTQGNFYNSSFSRITLVTTSNHLNKALIISPAHWGIMLAENYNEKIRLKHIRKAKNNPFFDKELALLTLWKSEMLKIVEEKKYKQKPRNFLAQLISCNKKKNDLSTSICDLLFDRHVNHKNSKQGLEPYMLCEN